MGPDLIEVHTTTFEFLDGLLILHMLCLYLMLSYTLCNIYKTYIYKQRHIASALSVEKIDHTCRNPLSTQPLHRSVSERMLLGRR
jgi:hypothetical protein